MGKVRRANSTFHTCVHSCGDEHSSFDKREKRAIEGESERERVRERERKRDNAANLIRREGRESQTRCSLCFYSEKKVLISHDFPFLGGHPRLAVQISPVQKAVVIFELSKRTARTEINTNAYLIFCNNGAVY